MTPRARVSLGAAALLTMLFGMSVGAEAQARSPGVDKDGEAAFMETLRREDPAGAERYVALRDARAKAIAELERAQQRYTAAGAELRALALPQLRQAQRTYAESTLSLLDFLDGRDRRLVESHQEQISRLNKLLEERARFRGELQRLLQGN